MFVIMMAFLRVDFLIYKIVVFALSEHRWLHSNPQIDSRKLPKVTIWSAGSHDLQASQTHVSASSPWAARMTAESAAQFTCDDPAIDQPGRNALMGSEPHYRD
ncbi:MAG: hypothetical protein ABI885_28995 [Gammaproteobacteria bacterium]